MAAFLFSVNMGMRLAVRGRVIDVPALVGMSVEDARTRLDSLELELSVSGERYDEQAPAGTVMSQWPLAGTGIKPKRHVQITVSLGRRENPVPDLTGRTVRAAGMAAEQAGYELGFVTELSLSEENPDRIISQEPPPNASESVAYKIDVLVNQAPVERYVMPVLTGRNLNQAIRFFKQNGFEIDRIQYQTASNVPRGSIMRQFPQAGHMLRSDQSIVLEVAR